MIEDNDTDRGQVGIGTLIVFIAMVLVAAIAAGVLVNTAGFLQSTAEETGEQSVDKVTNRLDVVNEHGLVNETTGGDKLVDRLALTVQSSSGAGEIDLNSTTIKYTSETTARNLEFKNETTNGGSDLRTTSKYNASGNEEGLNETEFTAVDLNDGGTSYPVLDEDDDRFKIVINSSVVEGSSYNGTQPGQSVQLELTTRSGGTTNVVLTMPSQLQGEEDDDPVPL